MQIEFIEDKKLMKCQILIPGEKKKNASKFCLLKILSRAQLFKANDIVS